MDHHDRVEPEGINLLAFDTSTNRATLALTTACGTVATAATDPAAKHGRTLLPAVRDLLAAAGLTARALHGVVVGLGPGSFTGLRIGVTAAKTIAYAAGAEVAGFDSLTLLARNAPPEALRVSVLVDAQRGDVYVADFVRETTGGPLVPVAPTRIEAFHVWADALPDGTVVLGPAAALERFAAGMPRAARLPDDPAAHAPDPDRLAKLAREVWQSGRRDDPWFLEPVYLRRSAAEEQWDKLGR